MLFIQFFIINFRYFLIAPRWNYSVYSIFHSKLNYTVIVIFLVCYRIFSGIPRASTTTCSFVFSPLLRLPCLVFHLSHHSRAYDILYIFADCNFLSQIPRLRHLVNLLCVLFPVALLLRQIPPRRSRPQNPEHGVNDLAIINAISTRMSHPFPEDLH